MITSLVLTISMPLILFAFLQVKISGVIYSESVGVLGIDDIWFSNGCHITGIVN